MFRLGGLVLLSAGLVSGSALVRDRRSNPVQIGIFGQSETLTDPDGTEYDRMVINKGQDVQVSFSLTTPPHCEGDSGQATGHCSITMALTNTRPDQVTLSRCYLRWNKDNWQLTQNVTISAVENFQDDGEKTIRIVTEPVDSSSEFYSGFDAPDIEVMTPRKPSGECRSTTDPNYRQFDGNGGVVNSAGTYNMWLARHRDWTVQTRVVNSQDGFNCGVAIRDGCHRVVLDRCSGSFVMRRYFSPDAASQPQITREGQNTYIITSRRSGARVRVQLNTRIIRSRGQSICGWSGCRVVYTYLRQDWMNVNMYAPGSDFGLEDTEGQSQFRTRGVCGSFDEDASNDGTVAQYVNQFRISQSNSYFQQAVPQNCESYTPPDFSAAECPIPPQRIMLPVISTVDVEDITDLIKRAQPGDSDDPRIRYNYTTFPKFDSALAVPPARSEEFMEKARYFCEAGLTTTSAFARCEALNINTDRFLADCLNDVQWQADPNAFADVNPSGESHNWMLESTLESMQQFCVSTAITNPDMATMVCNHELGICDTVTVNGVEKCIGDCTVQPLVDPLREQLVDFCPRNCSGRNVYTIDGEQVTPGRCVLNAENKTRCFCNEHFQGDDCSVRTDDLPIAEKVFPHGCNTNSGEPCPADVAVEGVDFYASETTACKWFDINNVETVATATVISSTIIRCELPSAIAQNDAANARIRVSITLDGAHWSDPLGFVYYDSTCWACHADGSCDHVPGTCFIDGACYAGDEMRVVPGEARMCQKCDPTAPNGDVHWTYQYADAACDVAINTEPWAGRNLQVPESATIGEGIDRSPADRFTIEPHGDDVDITWTMAGTGDYFTIGYTAGCSASSEEECYAYLVPARALDHESRGSIDLTITAHADGHASAPMPLTVRVTNVDEATQLTCSSTQAVVDENAAPGTPTGVECEYTDPDQDQAFGQVTMSVRGANAANFELRPAGNKFNLVTASPLDFEASSLARVAVVASTSAGGSVQVEVAVTVNDVNEPPVGISFLQVEVPETAAVGANVTQIVVNDPEASDRHTISIVGGNTGGLFRVVGDRLVVSQPLDFEAFANPADRFHQMSLRACDQSNLCFEQQLTMKITDGNDKPTDITLTDETTNGPVTELEENLPVGSTVGVLGAADDDGSAHHTYIICDGPSGCNGQQADPNFRILGENRLVLKAPLDYETARTVTVTVQIIDEHPAGPVVSDPKVFTIRVNDNPDVPRDFTVVLTAGAAQVTSEPCSTEAYQAGKCVGDSLLLLNENPTPTPAVIGNLMAMDQDNEEFTFSLPAESGFSVGAKSCQSESGAMVCSAPLSVVDASAVDFEGPGRETFDFSSVILRVTGTDASGLEGSGLVRIPIKNVNESPSGISYVRSNGNVGTASRIEVALGDVTIASLAARDPDSECPATVAGCSEHSSTEAHTFDRVGPSDIELSPACAEALPADVRQSSDRQCRMSFVGSVVPTLGAEYPVTVRVTDGAGESVEEAFTVVVVNAVLDVQVVSSTGEPKAAVQEYGSPSAAFEFDVALKISGWTDDNAPYVVLSGNDALGLGTPQLARRRDVTEWTVAVTVANPASIDYEEAQSLDFAVEIPSVGRSWAFALPVLDVQPEMPRVELCQTTAFTACQVCGASSETACVVTAVYDQQTLATQSFVQVGFDGSKTGVAATLQTGGTWVSVLPNGTVALSQSPQLESRDAGSSTNPATAEIPGSNLGSFFFQVHVTCPEGSVPTPNGACGAIIAGVDDVELEASEAARMDGGTVAGIVIAVLLIGALLVSFFMYKRNEAVKEEQLFDNSGKPDLVTGRANALYGWYQHNASKESAYAALSLAPAGDFIVRGPLRNAVPGQENPLYQIHVKTNQMVIKDELIDQTSSGFTLRGQPGAFRALNQLVDHYGQPNNGAGFSLNVPGIDNPMYSAVQMLGSEDIYGNSNIKNTRIEDDADAPALQAKRVQYIAGI